MEPRCVSLPWVASQVGAESPLKLQSVLGNVPKGKKKSSFTNYFLKSSVKILCGYKECDLHHTMGTRNLTILCNHVHPFFPAPFHWKSPKPSPMLLVSQKPSSMIRHNKYQYVTEKGPSIISPWFYKNLSPNSRSCLTQEGFLSSWSDFDCF